MAKFIINSAGTKAVRKDDIKTLEIDRAITGSDDQGNPVYGNYELKVLLWAVALQITFESAETLEAVQALATPILVALEE